MTCPHWTNLGHREKYRLLQSLSRSCAPSIHDVRDREIEVNGEYINDIPSFFLALGEAVNGEGGYFGKSLDSLSDCLCGGFGVKPPARIHIRSGQGLKAALDTRAWLRWELEFRIYSVESECSLEQLMEWGVLRAMRIPDINYFDEIISLCTEAGLEIRIQE